LRLSFGHFVDIFLHVLNKFTKTVSLCNRHAAGSLCLQLAWRGKFRNKQRSGCDVTSAKNGRLGTTLFPKGFSVYGHRDNSIGNPMKGNKPEVPETTCVSIPVKGDDNAFD
jgi:hypothetical protein